MWTYSVVALDPTNSSAESISRTAEFERRNFPGNGTRVTGEFDYRKPKRILFFFLASNVDYEIHNVRPNFIVNRLPREPWTHNYE